VSQIAASTVHLQAEAIECSRDDRLLFSDLTLELCGGEALILEGRNGTGKTTLLRILCGLRRPDDGEVRWGGVPIEECAVDFHRHMVYVGHLDGIKRELTALENLRVLQTLSGKGRLTIEEALDAVRLGGFEDIPVHYLSAGQKRRAALARLLVTDARLWVLDEPFTSLDVHGIELIESLMAKHIAAGGAMVMTSHHQVNLSTGVIKRLNLSER
jgi:heme exporter protein A